MILTEDEARTKRCCGPLAAGNAETVKTETDSWRDVYLCCGSQCMAWNFLTPGQAAGIQMQKGAVHEPFKAGYCGLAMKP